MSKAFTREDDVDDEQDDEPAAGPPLPIGARNYMTPGGFARLSAELDALVRKERPAPVATVATSSGRSRLTRRSSSADRRANPPGVM